MSILHALVLGLIQGLTEFIPVSSSGHLIIAHHFFGIAENGLTFDVALHIGTLLALLIFFYGDIVQLMKALVKRTQQTRLAWLLVLATIPAVIAGVLLESAAESTFRSAKLVSLNLIAVAIVMIVAEKLHQRRTQTTKLSKVSVGQALVMGVAQALALVPGVSRSGSTITAGLFAGLDRVAATRFSFLLAIPITIGATLKVLTKDSVFDQISNEKAIFLVGVLSAMVSGWFAIRFLLKFLAKHSLEVFAYYRIALGLGVVLALVVF